MTLDPILPLSISIADGERTYALFLGSGISKIAGIPTGEDILRNTIKLLYKMENEVEEVEFVDAVNWFKESKYKDMGYSEILENFPSQEDRRTFLERFFLGCNPTDAHYIIAEMVEKNLIKCIVTTNFDRLMEEALQDKGISFDVVSSKSDFDELKPREHSNCRILKLHGDYQKSNIKNTKKELEKLEVEIEDEFKDILDKYGVVVIGYSGSDEGVMTCLEDRNNPRYTLYWLTRESLNDRADNLIRQQNGKKIIRDSADEFLEELKRKIEIFQTHETGETPEFLIQQMKEYIQKSDNIGFRDTLKKQINNLRDHWEKIYNQNDEEYQEASKSSEKEAMKVAMAGFKEFEILADVICAMGLVLIEYGADDFFEKMLNALIEIYELSDLIFEHLRGTSYSWRPATRYIPRASVNNIFYCWGSSALKKENFNALKKLLNLKIIINDLTMPEITSEEIWKDINGENLATFRRDSVFIFKYLKNSYDNKEFLSEFFVSNFDFSKYLYQFSLLVNLISIKRYDLVASLPSTYLSRRKVREFIEPFLFKIKTENDFNHGISVVLDDIGPANGVTPKFIENYPDRCNKLKIDPRRPSRIPCDYFNRVIR